VKGESVPDKSLSTTMDLLLSFLPFSIFVHLLSSSSTILLRSSASSHRYP